MKNNLPKAICIMGPTCSGKTAIACEISKHINVELISVDSIMVYKGLNIGTAKPTTAELIEHPHHLIDICDPAENYSVGRFYEDINELVPKIIKRGNIPLLVGGTALYFHCLHNGINSLPESDAASKKSMINVLDLAKAYAELCLVDPKAANQINRNDKQRIFRALEVYRLTGKPISDYHAEPKMHPGYDFINIILLPDRAKLKAKIAERFDVMMQNGFIDEVQSLRSRDDLTLNNSAIRSVGYKQAWEYLDGKYDKELMQAKAKTATRQLAKRQITWFKKAKGEVFDSLDAGASIDKYLLYLETEL
jgi:tRNA dimethylallyltransferase